MGNFKSKKYNVEQEQVKQKISYDGKKVIRQPSNVHLPEGMKQEIRESKLFDDTRTATTSQNETTGKQPDEKNTSENSAGAEQPVQSSPTDKPESTHVEEQGKQINETVTPPNSEVSTVEEETKDVNGSVEPHSTPEKQDTSVNVKTISTLGQELTQVEQEHKQVEQEFKQVDQKPKEVEQKTKQAEQEVKQIEQEVKQVEQEVKEFEQEVKQVEQEFKQVEQEFKQIEQESQQIEQEFKQAEQEFKLVEKKSKKVKIELQQEPKEVEHKAKEMKQKAKEVQQEPKEVNQELMKVEQEVKQVEQEPQEMKQECKQVEEELNQEEPKYVKEVPKEVKEEPKDATEQPKEAVPKVQERKVVNDQDEIREVEEETQNQANISKEVKTEHSKEVEHQKEIAKAEDEIIARVNLQNPIEVYKVEKKTETITNTSKFESEKSEEDVETKPKSQLSEVIKTEQEIVISQVTTEDKSEPKEVHKVLKPEPDENSNHEEIKVEVVCENPVSYKVVDMKGVQNEDKTEYQIKGSQEILTESSKEETLNNICYKKININENVTDFLVDDAPDQARKIQDLDLLPEKPSAPQEELPAIKEETHPKNDENKDQILLCDTKPAELPNHIGQSQEKGCDPNLITMLDVEKELKEMKVQILHFSGTSKDAEYLTLHETLIRNIIKLDDIVVENNDEIRNERKRVIKFAQQCLSDVERKVENTAEGDGSDSE